MVCTERAASSFNRTFTWKQKELSFATFRLRIVAGLDLLEQPNCLYLVLKDGRGWKDSYRSLFLAARRATLGNNAWPGGRRDSPRDKESPKHQSGAPYVQRSSASYSPHCRARKHCTSSKPLVTQVLVLCPCPMSKTFATSGLRVAPPESCQPPRLHISRRTSHNFHEFVSPDSLVPNLVLKSMRCIWPPASQLAHHYMVGVVGSTASHAIEVRKHWQPLSSVPQNLRRVQLRFLGDHALPSDNGSRGKSLRHLGLVAARAACVDSRAGGSSRQE